MDHSATHTMGCSLLQGTKTWKKRSSPYEEENPRQKESVRQKIVILCPKELNSSHKELGPSHKESGSLPEELGHREEEAESPPQGIDAAKKTLHHPTLNPDLPPFYDLLECTRRRINY